MASFLSSIDSGFARHSLRIGMACATLIMGLGDVPAAPSARDPAAAATSGPAPAPAVGRAMPQLRADMKGAAASADVQLVADWMMRDNRHRGHPFVIADKLNGLIFAFDANGALLAKAPALFGAARADVLTEEQANKTIAEMLPADMITPAGVFAGEAYLSPNYGKSVRFASYANSNLLIHRAPGPKRLQRLQAANASETRVTLGCINAHPDFIEKVLMPSFSGESTVVILPEAQSARAFFAINDTDGPARQSEKIAAAK